MSCFSSTDGEFGEMVPEVLNPVNIGSVFTLNCKGWISSSTGTFTFLQTIDDAILTVTDVALSTKPLDASVHPSQSFQFQFTKIACPDSDPFVINYGDRVQLVNNKLKFAQCGAGTCSLVDDYGGCQTESWQTFTVVSATGKTGPVCFGDEIRLTQTAGTQCNMSAAGDNSVFCVNGDTANSVFIIFPVGGSLYVDPAEYVANYAKHQHDDLCKANPWDPSCIWAAIINFFHEIWIGVLIFVGIVILIIILVIIYYARQAISGL